MVRSGSLGKKLLPFSVVAEMLGYDKDLFTPLTWMDSIESPYLIEKNFPRSALFDNLESLKKTLERSLTYDRKKVIKDFVKNSFVTLIPEPLKAEKRQFEQKGATHVFYKKAQSSEGQDILYPPPFISINNSMGRFVWQEDFRNSAILEMRRYGNYYQRKKKDQNKDEVDNLGEFFQEEFTRVRSIDGHNSTTTG